MEVHLISYAQSNGISKGPGFVVFFSSEEASPVEALDGGLDIPHGDMRFVGYNKDGKSVDADVHRKYIFGGHVAAYMNLLVILLLLAPMIRWLGLGGYSGSGLVRDVGLDYDIWITEVEKILKKTTKMMQVHVEILDRKIDSEIAGLKIEVRRRIDDEQVEFGKKVGLLDGRVKEIEKLFGSGKWLMRDGFDKFVKDFKGVSDVGEARLDEIRVFAKENVEKEIKKHAVDGLGKVDYAVATGGASVFEAF